jgi:hypothetical protein
MSTDESLRRPSRHDGIDLEAGRRPVTWPFRLSPIESLAKLFSARREVRLAAREGRLRPGSPIADRVAPDAIPSVARLGTADRVLADVDQDGFLFARDPADVAFFDRRTGRLPRRRYELHVVLRDGVVCLRKRFTPSAVRLGAAQAFWSVLGLPFYVSAAAALRLSGVACAGSARAIDVRTRTIHWELVQGEDLRHWLGNATSLVHDLDLGGDPSLRVLDEASLDQREIEMFAAAGGGVFSPRVREEVRAMNAAGVAVLDVKLGNILVGAQTGRLYWVDFERAYLASWPRWEEAVRLQDQLLAQWFAAD